MCQLFREKAKFQFVGDEYILIEKEFLTFSQMRANIYRKGTTDRRLVHILN